MAIRVVVAEDNYLVREGICDVLADETEVEVVATVADYNALMGAVEDVGPGVVLTDIRMPPTQTDEGVRAAEELRDTHPEIGVVVLSQYMDPQYAVRLFDRGSARRAYLLKERVSHRVELVGAIVDVAAGGSRVDPQVVESLVSERSRAERSPLRNLTPREREVLAQVAQGKSNAAVAACSS